MTAPKVPIRRVVSGRAYTDMVRVAEERLVVIANLRAQRAALLKALQDLTVVADCSPEWRAAREVLRSIKGDTL